MRPQRLFDDIEPTEDPWRYSESDFELLRRADGSHWDCMRATLDEWYGKYPDPEHTHRIPAVEGVRPDAVEMAYFNHGRLKG